MNKNIKTETTIHLETYETKYKIQGRTRYAKMTEIRLKWTPEGTQNRQKGTQSQNRLETNQKNGPSLIDQKTNQMGRKLIRATQPPNQPTNLLIGLIQR